MTRSQSDLSPPLTYGGDKAYEIAQLRKALEQSVEHGRNMKAEVERVKQERCAYTASLEDDCAKLLADGARVNQEANELRAVLRDVIGWTDADEWCHKPTPDGVGCKTPECDWCRVHARAEELTR